MTTVRDIVTRAHKKIGIVSEGEEITADAIADGVDAYNMMLHAWKLQGVDVNHNSATASDDFLVGDEFEEGAVYLLASRISHDFEAPASFDADGWFRAIQAAFLDVDTVDMPDALVDLPSQLYHTGAFKYGIS